MVLTVAANGFVWYKEFLPVASNSINLSSTTPAPAPAENCAQFSARFGTTAADLMDYINDQPESAVVMKGYRNLYGEVISLTPGNNLPLLIQLDTGGKVTNFDCTESKNKRDYSQDIDFTIPETDFAQIVRYRESLEAEQASVYLKNLTTNSPEAKRIILERIQNLSTQ